MQNFTLLNLWLIIVKSCILNKGSEHIQLMILFTFDTHTFPMYYFYFDFRCSQYTQTLTDSFKGWAMRNQYYQRSYIEHSYPLWKWQNQVSCMQSYLKISSPHPVLLTAICRCWYHCQPVSGFIVMFSPIYQKITILETRLLNLSPVSLCELANALIDL